MARRLRRHGSEPDPLDRIRRAISTIDGHRLTTMANTGAALASQTEVEHECRQQLHELRSAREEISTALALALAAAQRVAAQPPAARDGTSPVEDPTPYVATAAGLRLALDAIESASAQMTLALEQARGNIAASRLALHRVREDLDLALREQIRQLGEVERQHRRRVLDARAGLPPT